MGDSSMADRRSDPGGPRVTFYVRGDMFGANDQQNDVVRRLRTLEDEGRIDDYDVSVWNGRVRLTDEDQPPVVDTYRRIESWANTEAVDIDPFFTVRERESFIDGTARELVLPVMCLVVQTEDGVVDVAPNVREGETRSVADCLNDLETLDAPARTTAMPAED